MEIVVPPASLESAENRVEDDPPATPSGVRRLENEYESSSTEDIMTMGDSPATPSG